MVQRTSEIPKQGEIGGRGRPQAHQSIVKLLKTKDKVKILKAAGGGEGEYVFTHTHKVRMT